VVSSGGVLRRAPESVTDRQRPHQGLNDGAGIAAGTSRANALNHMRTTASGPSVRTKGMAHRSHDTCFHGCAFHLQPPRRPVSARSRRRSQPVSTTGRHRPAGRGAPFGSLRATIAARHAQHRSVSRRRSEAKLCP
jgi:hypothetical protein